MYSTSKYAFKRIIKYSRIAKLPFISTNFLLKHGLAETDKSFSIKRLHSFWRQREPAGNVPENYSTYLQRSEYLYNILPKIDFNDPVIEIGCNVGRNLNYLMEKGFKNLTGIEINEHAISLMKDKYPKLYREADILIGPVEKQIINLPSRGFGITFTMAVLEHLHYDSDFVFKEITRITRDYIVTIEDETNSGPWHFKRNYETIFSNLGCRQIFKDSNPQVVDPVFQGFVTRVFEVTG